MSWRRWRKPYPKRSWIRVWWWIVSHGQTLFSTEGKALGHGHWAVCRPAPWSAYQSQCSIQSHDTWSMWLTGKFKISVWVESELKAWEMRWARSHKLEHGRNRNRECRKVASHTLAIAIADVMIGFTWLIKFLCDMFLYGHIPDPFPRCGIGSGRARLGDEGVLARAHAEYCMCINQRVPCRKHNFCSLYVRFSHWLILSFERGQQFSSIK